MSQHFFDKCIDIAQTAFTLGIFDVAGAGTGFNLAGNFYSSGGFFSFSNLLFDTSTCPIETVANRNVVTLIFDKHFYRHIICSKERHIRVGEINHVAGGFLAIVILHMTQGTKLLRFQQMFQRSALNLA